jgi:hypothetical protein
MSCDRFFSIFFVVVIVVPSALLVYTSNIQNRRARQVRIDKSQKRSGFIRFSQFDGEGGIFENRTLKHTGEFESGMIKKIDPSLIKQISGSLKKKKKKVIFEY